MATVRFSDSLKSEIKSNANRVFTPMVNKAKADYDKVEMGNLLYDLCVSQDIKTKIAALPEHYFSKLERSHFGGQLVTDGGRHLTGRTREGKIDHSMELHFTDRFVWNRIDPDADGFMLRYGDMYVPADPKFQPFFDKYWAWCDGIDAVEAKRDEFVNAVTKVINAYSTLAPALKAWPPLWDLVPSEYQERHKKVVERNRSATAKLDELDIDPNKMTAAVTMAKLTR